MSNKKKNKKPVFTKETIKKIKNVEKRMRDKPPADVPEVNNVLAESFGALTSAIMDLGDRMISLETRMESLETKVESIETKVESLETKVESLETKVEALEEGLGEVKGKVESLQSQMGNLTNDIGVILEASARPAVNSYINDFYGGLISNDVPKDIWSNVILKKYGNKLAEFDLVAWLPKKEKLIFIEIKKRLLSLTDFKLKLLKEEKGKGSNDPGLMQWYNIRQKYINLPTLSEAFIKKHQDLIKAKEKVSIEYWLVFFLKEMPKQELIKYIKTAFPEQEYPLKVLEVTSTGSNLDLVLEVRK